MCQQPAPRVLVTHGRTVVCVWKAVCTLASGSAPHGALLMLLFPGQCPRAGHTNHGGVGAERVGDTNSTAVLGWTPQHIIKLLHKLMGINFILCHLCFSRGNKAFQGVCHVHGLSWLTARFLTSLFPASWDGLRLLFNKFPVAVRTRAGATVSSVFLQCGARLWDSGCKSEPCWCLLRIILCGDIWRPSEFNSYNADVRLEQTELLSKILSLPQEERWYKEKTFCFVL